MSSLPPLDDELADLVRAEKAHAPAPPEEARAAVLGTLTARIAGLPAGGGGGGGGGDGGGGGSGAGGASGLAGFAAGHPIASVVSALILGAALGIAGTRAATPAPRIVYVDRPVPGAAMIELATESPSSSATPTPTATPPGPSAIGAASGAHAAATPSATAMVVDARGLAAERVLLDSARALLARGDAEEALAMTDRHARTYPQGLLREEREALAIKALAAAGRSAEARSRGARFREQFPRSVSMAAVNATLAALPE